MPRSLRIPVLVALAFTATAFMTVVLPNRAAAPVPQAPQAAIGERAPVSETAIERVDPLPRGRPVVVAVPSPTPVPTEEPTAPPTTAPVPVTAVVAPVVPVRVVSTPVPPRVVSTPAPPPPAACPATFFCYPRLGIAGAIVPYNDCSGATDVGSAIRQLTCVRAGIWLAGHAYTQFGGITGYRVGDIVVVRGQSFEITGASVQRACAPATGAIAPLSLQTSLDAQACGRVLVVQAR